jgi:urate oxidase
MEDKILKTFMTMSEQFRVLHWQTETAAQPKDYGEIYESISDLADKFMEEYMGKYGRCYFDGGYGTIRVYNINDMDIQKFVLHHIDIFNELNEHLDDEDTNLLNIRDEIIGELNRLKYLLTLK